MAKPRKRVRILSMRAAVRVKASRRSMRTWRRALGAHVAKVLSLKGEAQARIGNDPLASRLRRALIRDELVLHYQPLIDAASSRLVGAEALLRWNAPEIGEVPPAAVIPLAEQSGLIHAITLAVLNQALSQWRNWSLSGARLRMAVNLSPACLKDSRFPLRVATLLKAWNVPATYLELELTARDGLEDPSVAADVLAELRAMGVRITLDGLGGPTSLTTLKQLPVDQLKLDRAVVAGVATHAVDRAIVAALLNVARTLGCKAIATGIETEAAMEQLVEAGCDTLQGFWFGKPVPAEEFARRWLTKPGPVLMLTPSVR